MTTPRRVYVPARIQLQPAAALLVLDADGVEHAIPRASMAIVDSKLCLVANYIQPLGSHRHEVELGDTRLVVSRAREWDYRIDEVLGF